MIEVYKILNKYYDCDFPWIIRDVGSITRGNDFKLKVPNYKSSSKRRIFSYRVVNDWNSLPNEVVNAPSLNCFKNRLDKHWDAKLYDYVD